jgi:spermidine synthase
MADSLLIDIDTALGHYQVADTIYSGRKARVLYSGDHHAAQSGLAYDDNDDLLFEYNQRLRELVRGLRPHRVLLIGGGAFTLPKALLEEFPDMELDIVELDKELPLIAQRYFDFVATKNTRIFNQDGLKYLDNTKTLYDVILLDVFVHSSIPPSFQTVEAAQHLYSSLRPNGVVAMNIIASYHGRRAATLHRQIAALQAAFKHVKLFPAGRPDSLWLPDNYILTAQNDSHDLPAYFRYGSLDIPVSANYGE